MNLDEAIRYYSRLADECRRPGIIVWLENGDVLVYIPKPKKEQRL